MLRSCRSLGVLITVVLAVSSSSCSQEVAKKSTGNRLGAGPDLSNETADAIKPEDAMMSTKENLAPKQLGYKYLGSYLMQMGRKLDCYFTIEDAPIPGSNTFPWLLEITDFQSDVSIETIDELVTYLDEELSGVDVFRSQQSPLVIHLVAEVMRDENYVMDQKVTVAGYSGGIGMLPDHLGALLNESIESRNYGVLPMLEVTDVSTEITVTAEDETVRDILTKVVPLENYHRFLWESRRINEQAAIDVFYYGQKPTLEDTLSRQGIPGYLTEMGKRMDCYFTFEDDNPWEFEDDDPLGAEDEGKSWIANAGGDLEYNLDFTDIDTFISSLSEELNNNEFQPLNGGHRIEIVRNVQYPNVVHLIRKSLLQEGYALDKKFSVQFNGELEYFAESLGFLLDGSITEYENLPEYGFPRLESGGPAESVVEVDAEDEVLRNLITEAALQQPLNRLLWQAVQFPHEGPKVCILFGGSYNDYGLPTEVND